MKTKVKIKVLESGKKLLKDYSTVKEFFNRAYDDDAGADLRAASSGILKPLERVIVPCGFAMELERGWEAQVRPRSGGAIKNGVTVLNTPGTIDAGYRNEVGIIIINLSDKPFSWVVGDRIAQMVISQVPEVEFEFAEELSDSDRGLGGFGSSGT